MAEKDMNPEAALEALRGFVGLTHRFAAIERVIRTPGKDRWENDAEHSYQLALTAWLLADHLDLPLDRERILKYAIAHDLVEVYAGDTYLYSEDQSLHDTKHEREASAATRLESDVPPNSDILSYARGYMGKVDEEARFVYALDKILPILNIEADGGRTWKEMSVTLQMLYEKKDIPASAHEAIAGVYGVLRSELGRRESDLFEARAVGKEGIAYP